MFKKFRLIWADKVVLLLALFIAGAAFLFWISGMVGLAGHPHLRFDKAMTEWTVEAEFMLIAPLWLLLRVVDFAARALVLALRLSLGRARSGEFARPSYAGAGIRA